jgi:predicted PurR-regulated permease PerM
MPDAERRRFERVFLIILVIAITLLFAAMVRRFLITLFLAAILSGLAYPLYGRLLRLFRGRKTVASLVTLVFLLVGIAIPLAAFFALVVREALAVSAQARPWVDQLTRSGALTELLDRIPGIERLGAYREQILQKAGELVQALGGFVVVSLTAATRGTVTFFFHFFILLYAMFYFLKDGEGMLKKGLSYLPLPETDKARMLGHFVAVTRATLRGTLIIGVIQGTLAGIAFAIAGIGGAIFWGTVMTLLSVVPGIGSGLVWVPASAVLVLSGRPAAGILLALFCAGVVGSIDNLLRPRLVGRDTKLHDLFILIGTLGGVFFFGIFGFIIGPIVAALFVTVWEMYGTAFRGVLRPAPPSSAT